MRLSRCDLFETGSVNKIFPSNSGASDEALTRIDRSRLNTFTEITAMKCSDLHKPDESRVSSLI
jgi:hypothetical protein